MCELCVRDSPKGELKLLKLKPILNQGAGSPKKHSADVLVSEP